MPYDANLVLADDTLDWGYDNLVSYGTPDSTDKNAGGFVILDIKETGAKGMAAILIIDAAGSSSGNQLTVVLQASDSSTFASGIQTLCNFEVAGVAHGTILGNEAPCTVIRRFATEKRYVRIVASTTGDFYTVWCLLSPYPFYKL